MKYFQTTETQLSVVGVKSTKQIFTIVVNILFTKLIFLMDYKHILQYLSERLIVGVIIMRNIYSRLGI